MLQTQPSEIFLDVSVVGQSLSVRSAKTGKVLKQYRISTSRFGTGTEPGSFRTPTGRFRIHEKIGDGAEPGTVYKSRVPTGEIAPQGGDEDLVLTRILWLEGLETHNLNTRERYIYIHGTNQEHLLGQAASHGCVRMNNRDVIEVYERVEPGTEVQISEGSASLPAYKNFL